MNRVRMMLFHVVDHARVATRGLPTRHGSCMILAVHLPHAVFRRPFSISDRIDPHGSGRLTHQSIVTIIWLDVSIPGLESRVIDAFHVTPFFDGVSPSNEPRSLPGAIYELHHGAPSADPVGLPAKRGLPRRPFHEADDTRVIPPFNIRPAIPCLARVNSSKQKKTPRRRELQGACEREPL